MLGPSECFETTLIEQQKVKASKANIPANTFNNNPAKQQKFKAILDDPIIKILDDQSDQQIFEAGLKGMEQNFPNILTGDQKHLFMCPTAFNYDSRIQTHETSGPEAVEKKQEALEEIPNRSPAEEKDLKIIRDYIRRIRPQISEQETFDAFTRLFYPNRGIFIHSLKMDQYLKPFVDKARNYRKQNKRMGFGLTDLEERIAEALNISQQSLSNVSDKVKNRLTNKGKITTANIVDGRSIREAIDDELKKDEKEKAKTKFKPGQNYTVNEMEQGVKLGKFESMCKWPGENDLFIMLPDKRLIVCVEVKRHMEKDKNQSNANSANIDGNLQSAAHQLKKNAYHTSYMHGAILSPGWRFVKVAAISPYVYNKAKICLHCDKFIVSPDMIQDPREMLKWWKNTGLDGIQDIDGKTKQQSYDEFLKFFNRLVNLSSVRVRPEPSQAWSQIQGNNPRHISAGYTSAAPSATSGQLDIENIQQRPHDAYKVLCLNEDQEALLSNDIPLLVFVNDFGSGKILFELLYFTLPFDCHSSTLLYTRILSLSTYLCREIFTV